MALGHSELRATPLAFVAGVAFASLAACGGGDGEGSAPTGNSSTEPTSAEVTSTDPTSSGAAAVDTSTGAADSSTGADTIVPPETTGPPPPPPPPRYCSLAAVDPTADPEGIIDMGDAEGQIPTLIGEAMLRNCGCHFTDKAFDNGYVGYTDDDRSTIHLDTLADFHLLFVGTFPMNYEDRPMYEAMEVRVVDQLPLPMPSEGCDVDGERGVITAADQALFAAWLEQDAPDAVTFVPPKG